MDFKELQGYAYFFMTILFVGLLYGYIVYLYRSEKKGEKDYEKYGKLALDDEISSNILEKNKSSKEKKGAK
jgi:cytochrome c oxidase cbb3-type subunit IV